MATLKELRSRYATKTPPLAGSDKPAAKMPPAPRKTKAQVRKSRKQRAPVAGDASTAIDDSSVTGRTLSIGIALCYLRCEAVTEKHNKYWEAMVVDEGAQGYTVWRHFGQNASTPHIKEKTGRWERVERYTVYNNHYRGLALGAMRKLYNSKMSSRPEYHAVDPEFNTLGTAPSE